MRDDDNAADRVPGAAARVGWVDLRIFTEPQLGASYDDLLRVARAAEELGFDAFFRSDHFLAWAAATACPDRPTPG